MIYISFFYAIGGIGIYFTKKEICYLESSLRVVNE